MRPRLLLTVGLLVGSVAPTRAQAPISDPRPAGSQLADTTGSVDGVTRAAVDEIARRAPGEILIVVTDTVGGQPPRAFATSLFNRLGIGSPARDDGVLLFLALDDRKAEIVLGDGLTVPTAVTDQIMAEVLLPHMKRGDLSGALLATTEALVDRVFEVPAPSSLVPPAASRTSPAAEAPERPVVARRRATRRTGSSGEVWGWFVGALGVAGAAAGRLYWRYRRRRCGGCGLPLVRLGETADDDHLSPGERTEERIGSVDYDVWICPRCGTVRKIGWKALLSRYGSCASCGTRARRTRSEVVVAATEWSSGLAEVTEWCEHCGAKRSYTRTLPRKPRSDRSSGSSSSHAGGGSSSGRGSSGGW